MKRLLLTILLFTTINGNSLADNVDKAFLPHVLYTSCMASNIEEMANFPFPRGSKKGLIAKQAFCDIIRKQCIEKPEDQKCKDSFTDFHVLERAADSSFALFTAASIGNMDVLNAMIAKAIDLNAPIPGLDGWTPVMIASAERRGLAVLTLLKAGADPNRKNNLGRTALMFAASYGLTEIVRDLLDHKADPNIVPEDNIGWTALIAAACNGHAETVRLLLDRGANSTIKDKQGKTALACAEDQQHFDVVRTLRTRPETIVPLSPLN